MSSFEKVSPGIKDLFFNQYMAQKLPEKKIPSTALNATNLSEKSLSLLLEIHFVAQSAFFLTEGTF